jgi:hypothetical protein
MVLTRKVTGENNQVVDIKRQEALLNEYKGNIFEYLVCIELGKCFKKEIEFLLSIPPDMLSILEQQESFLRNHYSHLLIELPTLAKKAVTELIISKKIKSLSKIILVGKKLASTQDTGFNESDLLVYLDEDTFLSVSVKLSKMNSFVNTKSAGIRTVFNKYFGDYNCTEFQTKFNHFVDIEYESFAMDMHNEADIHYTTLFENWERSGHEVLPGQLDGKFHEILINYYKKINKALYGEFLKLNQLSSSVFRQSLYKLMGFSGEQIIQLTAFYQQKENVFIKTKIEVCELKDILKSIESKIVFKCNLTNFEISFAGHILQVRIKPMNKFTSKAFKINCSIKNIS